MLLISRLTQWQKLSVVRQYCQSSTVTSTSTSSQESQTVELYYSSSSRVQYQSYTNILFLILLIRFYSVLIVYTSVVIKGIVGTRYLVPVHYSGSQSSLVDSSLIPGSTWYSLLLLTLLDQQQWQEGEDECRYLIVGYWYYQVRYQVPYTDFLNTGTSYWYYYGRTVEFSSTKKDLSQRPPSEILILEKYSEDRMDCPTYLIFPKTLDILT